MSKEITVQLGQSLVDIAVQELGSAEGLIDILRANPTIEHADELTPGTKLTIDSAPINIEVASFFSNKEITVATVTNYPVDLDLTGVFDNTFNQTFS